MSRLSSVAIILAITLAPIGCGQSSPPPRNSAGHAGAAPTNRVDINASVRQNLGITFANVERRDVARTLRIPGRFELIPTAQREYRAQAPGTVELLVEQYQAVEARAPLYRLDSPRWRELQKELTEADAAVKLAQAGVDSIGPFMAAHESHHQELQHSIDLWSQRITSLEALRSAGGARGDEVSQAQAALASARAALAETLEKEAELTARERETKAQLEAARSRFAFLLEAAASLAGHTSATLATTDSAGRPRWQTLAHLEVAALSPGIIDSVHAISGAVIDSGHPIITTVQPDRVRFRAHGLQSDLGRLTNGLAATVVAPQGGSLAPSERIPGFIALAPTAEPDRRTIELVMTPTTDPGAPVPPWARAGVSAFLEVVIAGTPSDSPDLAIPLSCVARDGTRPVIFRRDPADPNKAIRLEADLGIDDGRWIVVKSGVAEGDEIVLDGVYQLMVATSGSITKGGHFHPDGTFHEGED